MNQILKKTLNFPSLVLLGIAGVIGSSWIYTTSAFFSEYGAGGVIFGMICACLLASCTALAFAELAAQFPRAGGSIIYAFISYNKLFAFITGWILIGSIISNTAFYMSAFGDLISKGIPSLKPYMESIHLYTIAGTPVYLLNLCSGIVLVSLAYILSMKRVDVGFKSQIFLFLIILLLGITLGFSGITFGKIENFWPPFITTQTEGTLSTYTNNIFSIFRFIIPGLTFLTGFSIVAQLSEEASVEAQKIGIAIILAVFGAGGYYCFVLLGTAMIIPWELSASMDLGAISAFTFAGYPWLSYSAITIAFLGMGTGMLGMMIGGSRLILAMGRSGLLPSYFSKINENGIPVNALKAIFIITLSLGWLGKGAMIWFLDTGGVYVGIIWIITIVCMYKIRSLYPNNSRPYKTKFTWLPMFGALGAIGVLLMTLIPGTSMSLVTQEYIIIMGWILLGTIIYFLYIRHNNIPKKDAINALLGNDSSI